MSLISREKLFEDIEYWEQHAEPGMKDYDKRDIEQVVWSQPTVEAIPITDFFRMISNVKLDCDDDIKFSSEYFDGYGDGTRNAVVEIVQALCGDRDGDCDEFWEKYFLWEKESKMEEGK